jgi:NADH-quinone oxidoreductase subunit A
LPFDWKKGDALFKIFFPFACVLFLAALIPAVMILIPQIAAIRKPSRRQLEPYECGVDAVTGDARGRFNIKYFAVALCFLVFDIEVVFLFPWAVLFRTLGSLGLVEMFVFLGVLLVGLVYIWKKGVFSWKY